jgi:ABC-2 type transport system permease protein
VINLVRSEILKIRTTNTWWLMMLGLAVITGLALWLNIFTANDSLNLTAEPPDTAGLDEQTAADVQQQWELNRNIAFMASNVYTSGQYIGLLLAMLIGILVITNEFFHQTATPTFLASPRRENVIAAKLGGALTWGIAFGILTTVLSVIAGATFFSIKGVGTQLDNTDVLIAIALNLMAFGIWAVFGLGIGTLLKNQIASIVVALVLYLVAQTVVTGLLYGLSQWLDQDWIQSVNYYLPSGASSVMTSAVKLAPEAPPWWAGALTLLAYGVVTAAIGTLITKRRDIS